MTCVESHGKCRKGLSGYKFGKKEESILPSRVVHVGLGSSSTVLLVTTNGERGRYCALSYCWGPKSPKDSQTTLLRATLDRFERSLPVKELPKPIQEAIEVAYRLDIPYLWVDRLCIVQDKEEDIEAECDRMCDIYERAFLTLAALGDDTGNKGLFLDREVLDYPTSVTPEAEIRGQNVRLSCTVKDKRIGDVYLGKVLSSDTGPHEDRDSESCFGQELEESRWVTRGWILQERLLSRRIVYFGKRQLY